MRLFVLPVHAADPLQNLQSGRGDGVAEYERAVAGDGGFAKLKDAPSAVVALADGSPDVAGVRALRID